MAKPSYFRLVEEGILPERIRSARELLDGCRVCPHECGVDRIAGETGLCHTGNAAMVSSYNAHFGEEAPLVGRHGSGTIFFTHCNLGCLFCQNYDISHDGYGRETDAEFLAGLMVKLAVSGCHNINFVTPTHVVPQILEALPHAVRAGLDRPLVYNSGGYDRVETLKLLDGIVDIYMPDFKFWDNRTAQRYCNAPDYADRAREAILEMHRQVGDLELDENNAAVRGLLVRHLVMPGQLAGTREICHFLADEVSSGTYINIMGQYRPYGRGRRVSGTLPSPDPRRTAKGQKRSPRRRIDPAR